MRAFKPFFKTKSRKRLRKLKTVKSPQVSVKTREILRFSQKLHLYARGKLLIPRCQLGFQNFTRTDSQQALQIELLVVRRKAGNAKAITVQSGTQRGHESAPQGLLRLLASRFQIIVQIFRCHLVALQLLNQVQ